MRLQIPMTGSRSTYPFQVFSPTIVVWSSKKQTTVATLSSSAQYVALSAIASGGIWLVSVLGDLGEGIEKLTIYEDNQGSIVMGMNAESKKVMSP